MTNKQTNGLRQVDNQTGSAVGEASNQRHSDTQVKTVAGTSTAGEGLNSVDTRVSHAPPAVRRKRKVKGEGHANAVTPLASAPPQPSADDQVHGAAQAILSASSADGPTITQIRWVHRKRCFAMEQRKRIDLALGAYVRTQLGWRLSLPENERKAIAEKAAAIIENPTDTIFEDIVVTIAATRAPFEAVEKDCVKHLTELAEMLPAWEAFGKPIRGFGPVSLATIVAEAGDLSLYANPAKLWKRMGVGVIGNVRQGGLPKNASKEEWILHGYNRQRRSRLWNIGDALIKSNKNNKTNTDGYYREVYLDEKAKQIERDPEIKPIKAHRRAQRYMEKRLLKNLWQAWRASRVMSPDVISPANLSSRTSDVVSPNEGVSGTRRAVQPLASIPVMPADPSSRTR